MRKIESQMNAAIQNGVDFKMANTRVENIDGVSFVFLHGNKIAEVGDTFIRLFDGGWQSTTTKSRLNAILGEHGVSGEHIFQKAGVWFLRTVQGVKPSDSEGFVSVPFFSGMRLN
jgi:hypothetical protein